MSAEPAPARRADAERNRSKIIAVAREAFAEPGAAPSMAEIARRAGVGMATLYRNFPGRLELVEELFRHTVDDMCQAAESVSGDTPGEAFFAWLMRFHAIGARKGPLASVLLSESANGTPILRASRSRTIAAGEPLFRAAQRSGEVRDDVSLGQILDGLVALAGIDNGPDFPGALIRILLAGLHPNPHTTDGSQTASEGIGTPTTTRRSK
ncbi:MULTISPECIES: TetR/AcrR family transcriptional regulator [Streptomyces]|uniref:TetR/AcrR family transcriptional regulator n=1 Tax=Streptomyces flaveolus TaxID=67297 RepID=A0ABV1VT73_9ACTN